MWRKAASRQLARQVTTHVRRVAGGGVEERVKASSTQCVGLNLQEGQVRRVG